MALTEKVTFLLSTDSRGVVREFQKVERAADKSLGKAEKKIDRLGATFTKVGAGLVGAAGLAGAALASTIGPASDLNEAINVTGLTFGESADEIEDWASTAAKSIGQSKRAALEGASAIGGLLLNVGFLEDEAADLSKELVTLASDMGSAFNTDPADALAALRSGLAGESEPLKRYNVFINEAAIKTRAFEMNLGDATGALSDNEKAQARLSIIMEQTARIQGDFASTADGAANAQRTLNAQLEDAKAQIGQAVLPLFEQLVGAANDLFGAFNALDDDTKQLVGRFGLLAVGLAGGLGAFTLVIGKAIKMRAEFKKLPATLQRTAVAAGAMFAAFTVGQTILGIVRDRAAEVEAGVQSMIAALESASSGGDALNSRIAQLIKEGGDVGKILDDLSSAQMAQLVAAMTDGESSTEDFAAILNEFGVGATRAQIVAKALGDEYAEATRRTEAAKKATADLSKEMGSQLVPNMSELNRQGSTYVRQTKEAEAETEDLTVDFGLAADKATPLGDAIGHVNDQLSEYFGILTDPANRTADFEASIDRATDLIAEHGNTLDADNDKGRDNIAARSAVISEIEKEIDAMIDRGATTDEIVDKAQTMIDRLREEAAERGIAKDTIDDYIGAADNIPKEVRTRLIQTGYSEGLDLAQKIKDAIDKIPPSVTVRLNTIGELGGIAPPNVSLAPNQRSAADQFRDNFTGVFAGSGGGGVPGANVSVTGQSGGGITEVVVPVSIDGRELTRTVARHSNEMGGVDFNVRGAR